MTSYLSRSYSQRDTQFCFACSSMILSSTVSQHCMMSPGTQEHGSKSAQAETEEPRGSQQTHTGAITVKP